MAGIAVPRRNLKLRNEHKIAIGFTAVALISYFGYQGLAAYTVDRIAFPQIKPGRVSIIGVNAGKGYRIIVANRIAQLITNPNEEFGSENIDYNETDDTGGNKKRVPLREMLQSLSGDELALGKLITGMNDDLKKADMPSVEVPWTPEDVQKAINGDAALKTKLEQDLNVHLDGTPLDEIRPQAMQNGIVLVCKVPIKVSVEGTLKTLHGEIRIPYRPHFVLDVLKRYENDFNPTTSVIKGNYAAEVTELEKKPGNREDVAKSLRNRIDPKTLIQQYSDAPSRILANAFVVLNESFVESCTYKSTPGPNGKLLYTIVMNLTDEGRKRLWQFSRRNKGAQLLVVEEGVAVAAPRIRSELAQSEISITQLPDEGLVQDTVDLINSRGKNHT